jgi:transcriptional antiterminator RfaH
MIMQWYVMQSKPKKEEFLHDQLCARGIETFYPCLESDPASKRPGKRKPYFPRYLFVLVDLEKIGDSVLKWMPGSIGLVQFGGESAVVPDSIIQGIKRKLETLNYCDEKIQRFEVGDEVIIQSEIFKNYKGIFDGYISGQKRAQVLLRMLNDRQVRMELSIDDLEDGIKH